MSIEVWAWKQSSVSVVFEAAERLVVGIQWVKGMFLL